MHATLRFDLGHSSKSAPLRAPVLCKTSLAERALVERKRHCQYYDDDHFIPPFYCTSTRTLATAAAATAAATAAAATHATTTATATYCYCCYCS